MLRFFGSSKIGLFVEDYFGQQDDLDGKIVVDIPAGAGDMSRILADRGAEVVAFDLFPEYFEVEGLTCKHADLMDRIPMEDRSADIVLCQEGIEHLPDQLAALREMNRILKPGGTLVLTTPSISNLRARLSHFLTESEVYKRMPPNELDALWFSGDNRLYFGHLFLIGIQRLRALAVAAGFELHAVLPVRASTSSVLLGVTYPVIWLVNAYAYRRNLRKNPEIPREQKESVYSEIRALNTHPTILFGRHLFIEFTKRCEPSEIDLYVNRRTFGP